MAGPNAITDEEVSRYEGLIFTTAQRYKPYVPDEFEDLQQMFRIKVWKALQSYDKNRSRMTQDRYVFSCVVNQGKDLIRSAKVFAEDGARSASSIEDIAPEDTGSGGRGLRNRFEERYMSVDRDDVFAVIEEDGVLIPSTLGQTERSFLAFLYLGYSQTEIGTFLGLSKSAKDGAMASIRKKMADWAPTKGLVLPDVDDPEADLLVAA